MPHRVQSLKAEKEWASILEKNQVLERGNLAKEKSPKDILVFRLQWHGWSAYKTAGNKMDIQLQCSSKSKEREKDEHLKFWLAGKEEARDGRPLPLCSLDYGCLGNRVMPQWHTLILFSTNFLDFLPAHVVSSVGRWLWQPSSLELQHFLFAGQKFTWTPKNPERT